MSKLYTNKFRIQSARLENWDYANEAMYFVTICTKDRINYFGEIVKEPLETQGMASSKQTIASLLPTEIGKIARSEWYKTIELRPDMNLELGEFIVMPNHVHGIIIIGKNDFNISKRTEFNDVHGDARHRASKKYKNRFSSQSKNLASIIRGYKSSVTMYARKNDFDFEWQPRFHDQIIRSTEDYFRISNYIRKNPMKWNIDKFYRENRK